MAHSQRHLRSGNKEHFVERGLTIELGKLISTIEAYKQGMEDGRQKAFITKNGYPINHTATIRLDSDMYRECQTCPLKFR